jgi:DnaA-homolog protein
MTPHSSQIPFELFEAEAPSFANFLVGNNTELVTYLYELAQRQQLSGVVSIWSGPKAGKSHLLKALVSDLIAKKHEAIVLGVTDNFPDSPFVAADVVAIDDVDSLSQEQQVWAFNAFNHVVAAGGFFLATGSNPPLRWPIRDDLRTRLASGLVFELQPVPQDELPTLTAAYAQQRGVALSEEVLAYVLTRTQRDVAALCQTISGIDRLSLSTKRPITIPLVRAFLAQQAVFTGAPESAD